MPRCLKVMLSVAFCVFCAAVASAPSWAGMPVTDTTSYTYYVEQLKKDVEKIENQLENIAQVKNVYDETKKVYGSLTGIYEDITAILEEARRLKEKMGNPSAMLDYLNQFFEDSKDIEKYMEEAGYIDTEKLLNDKIKDTSSVDVSAGEQWAVRKAMQQLALKKAIVEADQITQRMPKDLERLEELIGKIKSSTDMKESMDLNNHFQAEILAQLQSIKALLARFVASESLLKVRGTSQAKSSSPEPTASNYMEVLQPFRDYQKNQSSSVSDL